MKTIIFSLSFIFLFLTIQSRELIDPESKLSKQINRVNNDDITFEFPHFIFSHTNTVFKVKFKDPKHVKLGSNNNFLHFIINGNDQVVEFDKNGEGTVSCTFKNSNKLSVLFEDVSYNMEMPVISIWYIVFPMGALLLFLMYKIAFGKKNLSLLKREETDGKTYSNKRSNLKVVSHEEEEVLV